jgi:hypothetical protein
MVVRLHRPTSSVLAGALIGALAAALPAQAATPRQKAPQSSEEWIQEGVQRRMADQKEQALEAFQRAHSMAPSPRTLGQMGYVLHDMSRFLEAEARLTEALASKDHPWVKKYEAELEETLNRVRSHIGHLTIKGPPGAVVKLKGEPIGTLPLPNALSLLEGQMVWVAVSAPGFFSWEQRVTIEGGRDQTIRAELVPERKDLPDLKVLAQEKPLGNGAVAAAAAPGDVPPDAPDDRHGRLKILRWSLLSGGAGAMVAGGVWWHEAAKLRCENPQPGFPCSGRSFRKPVWPAQVVLGVGAAAAVAGVALFFYPFASDEKDLALQVRFDGFFVGGTW